MAALPPPPAARRGDDADLLHGERIADPYRWLESGGPETDAWTARQNARTRAALDALTARPMFAARLQGLLALGTLGVPWPVGDRIFYARRAPGARQAVLRVRQAGEDRVLVDPNRLDAAGLVTLDWWYPAPDGRTVAFGLSRGGTELSTLHLCDVESGALHAEEIPHTQRARVTWAGNAAFYYTVHPAPGSVAPGDEHYHTRVRHHRLGTDPADDPVVFGEGLPKETIVSVVAEPAGRWAIFSSGTGWSRNDLFLHDGTGLRPVIQGADGRTEAAIADGRIWLRTNVGSPNARIAVADPERPERWETVVPEGDWPIVSFDATRAHLVVQTLEHAVSRLAVWSHRGVRERELALPPFSALLDSWPAVSPAADPLGDRFGYTVHSFAAPPTAYVADARTGASEEVVRLELPPDVAGLDLVVAQDRYRSSDGTEVPMFLIHRRDVRPTGKVPTILNGYGGFNVARTPAFSAATTAWAAAGGLWVVANLRGGAEYGEPWHRAGMRERKQQVFDDFAAAAEALVARGWTTPAQLGCYGGSNGGLLVGAALAQRPERFAAVACAVPLLDMLRYQHFLIARLWIDEYGSAEDPAAYRWLRAYSPYHNLRPGTRYPAVLFTTAEGDSRVDPGHARKMAALLQWLQRDEPDAVTLLRVDRDAGHGVGKPLDLLVDDQADLLAFFAWRLGLPSGERLGTVAAGR